MYFLVVVIQVKWHVSTSHCCWCKRHTSFSGKQFGDWLWRVLVGVDHELCIFFFLREKHCRWKPAQLFLAGAAGWCASGAAERRPVGSYGLNRLAVWTVGRKL